MLGSFADWMTSARNLRSLGLCLVALGASLPGCEAKTVTLGHQAQALSGATGQGASGGGTSAGAAGSSGSAGSPSTAGVPSIPTFTFGPGTLVEELRGAADDENPTLTEDLLEIYFISSRDADSAYEVFYAERSSRAAAFSAGRPVPGVNVAGESVTSPAISLDGLTLWVGRKLANQVPAQYDIYQYTRSSRTSPWVSRGAVAALNSATDDIPRSPGLQERVMPLGSRRAGDNYYRLYFAERLSEAAPFQAAPELVIELDFVNAPEPRNTTDGFLTQDGLTLLFASTPISLDEDHGDLFIAQRATTDASFGAPRKLSLSTPENDERDPWLSPDGRTLYYVSDASGDLDIYVAPVTITP